MASWSFPFVPNLQRRLLKHVLSRLDILDTDALSDESLDFAWGKTSTIELRKVGLRFKARSIPCCCLGFGAETA